MQEGVLEKSPLNDLSCPRHAEERTKGGIWLLPKAKGYAAGMTVDMGRDI